MPRIVYILESEIDPARHYVGSTTDVRRRLAAHNAGGSVHTRSHRPWRVLVAMMFSSENSARAFERYLKTGSGRAFSKRHFR